MDENEKKEASETERKTEKINPLKRFGRWLVRKKNAFVGAVRERTKEVKHAKAKRIALAMGACLVVLLFVVFYLTVGKMIAGFINDADAFKEWMYGFDYVNMVLIFLLLRILQTAFKLLPGSALEIAAGFIFGVWEGFLWCMVGSFIGSILILFLGKKYGMRLVGLFVDPEKLHAATAVGDKTKKNFAFFIMYFLPGTPKDVFTWVASITEDDTRGFMCMSMLARIPSVLVSTWCGDALVSENYVLSLVIFALLIVGTVLGAYIYKKVAARHRANAENAENTERVDEQAEAEEKEEE